MPKYPFLFIEKAKIFRRKTITNRQFRIWENKILESISRVNLTIWNHIVHICCDFRKFLILFSSAIQLITLHVYESIKYSPGECKKILIWISTWCNITLLFGGLWIISSLFVKCIIKVGLFCEEAEGKAPSERRRSRDSVSKKCARLKGFQLFNENISIFYLKLFRLHQPHIPYCKSCLEQFLKFKAWTFVENDTIGIEVA